MSSVVQLFKREWDNYIPHIICGVVLRISQNGDRHYLHEDDLDGLFELWGKGIFKDPWSRSLPEEILKPFELYAEKFPEQSAELFALTLEETRKQIAGLS